MFGEVLSFLRLAEVSTGRRLNRRYLDAVDDQRPLVSDAAIEEELSHAIPLLAKRFSEAENGSDSDSDEDFDGTGAFGNGYYQSLSAEGE